MADSQPGLNPFNIAIGGSPFDPENDSYNHAQFILNNQGKQQISESRKKFAPNKDKATIASSDKGKKLPEAIKQAEGDPYYSNFNSVNGLVSGVQQGTSGGGASSSLPSMYSQLAMVRDTMNATEPTQQLETLTQAFFDSLVLLAANTTFLKTVTLFDIALMDGAYSNLSANNQLAVGEGLALFIIHGITYGEDNLPIPTYPLVTSGANTPSPIVEFIDIPQGYFPVFYINSELQYPGYLEFQNGTGSNTLWVALGPEDYQYEYLTDAMKDNAAQYLFSAWLPYIDIPSEMSSSYIEGVLNYAQYLIYTHGWDGSLGFGVVDNLYFSSNTPYPSNPSKGGGGSAAAGGGGGGSGGGSGGSNPTQQLSQMLQQFMQKFSQPINNAEENHIPNSVLDKDKMKGSLNDLSKILSLTGKMKGMASGAFDPMSAMDMLQNASGSGGQGGGDSGGGSSDSSGGSSGGGADISSILGSIGGSGGSVGGISPSSVATIASVLQKLGK